MCLWGKNCVNFFASTAAQTKESSLENGFSHNFGHLNSAPAPDHPSAQDVPPYSASPILSDGGSEVRDDDDSITTEDLDEDDENDEVLEVPEEPKYVQRKLLNSDL